MNDITITLQRFSLATHGDLVYGYKLMHRFDGCFKSRQAPYIA
jgi:hypothetical protein